MNTQRTYIVAMAAAAMVSSMGMTPPRYSGYYVNANHHPTGGTNRRRRWKKQRAAGLNPGGWARGGAK